jgi:hypothetical protein
MPGMRMLAVVVLLVLSACDASDVAPQEPECLPNDARVQFSVGDDGAAVACPTADAIENATWAYYAGRGDVHVTGCEWRCVAWDCELRTNVTAFFIQAEDGRWEPAGVAYQPGVTSCP